MKLFHSPASPFVRKVAILLHETGQMGDVEIVPVRTTVVASAPEIRAVNPLAKIPALQCDDGMVLYDSRVICAYLDARAQSGLYAAGWQARILEATADGLMDAAVSMSYETRLRPADKQWPEWIAGQRQKVLGACSAVEAHWMGPLGGPVEIGQIAMGAALGYLDFRHGDLDWRSENPKLCEWFSLFSQRSSMQATAPTAP